jgi:hypothetical protein
LPASGGQRRMFWDSVNSLFLYSQPLPPEEWPVASDGRPDGGHEALAETPTVRSGGG